MKPPSPIPRTMPGPLIGLLANLVDIIGLHTQDPARQTFQDAFTAEGARVPVGMDLTGSRSIEEWSDAELLNQF